MISLGEIAKRLDAKLVGDAALQVHSVASLDQAGSKNISFLTDSRWKGELDTTQAGCVLLSPKVDCSYNGNKIFVDDPYLAYALVAQMLDSTPKLPAGVHSSACIADDAILGKNIAIAAGAVIENGAKIADGASIGANCFVGENSIVGENSRLYPSVTVYHGVSIGENCIFHSGSVVGSDGFGFANENRQWIKIPQTGGVVIGDNVEIGANSCIDRGALNDTIIGNGVKIDNACHIAHNVEIGDHVAMAACSGIAGSSKIGEYTTLSGRSSVIGHLNIAAGSHITACSLINKSIDKPGIYSSGTGMQENKMWRKNVARFRQLNDMARQLKQLQKELQQLKDNHS